MANINTVLDGVTLPEPTSMNESIVPIESDNITLDGTLYNDFGSVRRMWTINWKTLCKADYDDLRGIWDDQYTNKAYPNLTISFYSVSNVDVKMSINERDIYWDGEQMRDITITLKEQLAII